MRNLLLVLPTPILKLGVFLYLRVLGATQFLTVRFNATPNFQPPKGFGQGFEPCIIGYYIQRKPYSISYFAVIMSRGNRTPKPIYLILAFTHFATKSQIDVAGFEPACAD